MSSIPTSFDQHTISTITIGGALNKNDSLNISVILLNSGRSHLRSQIFDNLLACNFSSIISVEKNIQNYGIEELSRKYPEIKFLMTMEPVTDGEIINIAMKEVTSDYVLVLRDNLYIPSGIILTHLAEKLTKNDVFCVVPRLMDNKKVALACSFMPAAEKTKFIIDSSTVATDGIKTLYPLDYIALYNRKKFILLGGFDFTIKSPYWQNLDLALRAWLWGEQIRLTTLLQFSYMEETIVEDKTANLDSLRFYLKNELPKLKNGYGVIKPFSFWIFYFNSSCGFIEARRQFKEARTWVKENKNRFKMDLQTLITKWSEV